jgi:host factor-I protein
MDRKPLYRGHIAGLHGAGGSGALPADLHFQPSAVAVKTKKKAGDRQMENKPAQNIQDTFLNTVRKDKTPITIYLVSGVKLTGRIRSFDKYSVLLENNSQEQLIFKHAISTVVSGRAGAHLESRTEAPRAAVAHPTASAVAAVPEATGTQGH